MRLFLLFTFIIFTVKGQILMAEEPEDLKPSDFELVNIKEIIPDIDIELLFATKNNIFHEAIYDSSACYLRRGVAERLDRVQKNLKKMGYGLKIWEGYRPYSATLRLWDKYKDPQFVADPKYGSKHNRGAAVDVTLIDHKGKELSMPSEYCEFTERANRKYNKGDEMALYHRDILENAMAAEGFIPYRKEWWHFNDKYWESYPIIKDTTEEKCK